DVADPVLEADDCCAGPRVLGDLVGSIFGIPALHAQRDKLRILERLGPTAVIDFARRKVRLPAVIIAKRQPVLVDVLGELWPSDEGYGDAGGSPRASDEAADRSCPQDRNLWSPRHDLPPAAIRLHPLVWKPQAFWRSARLPEDVDRHAATRIPVSANAQPFGFHLIHQALANANGDVLVKTAVIAERAEEQL